MPEWLSHLGAREVIMTGNLKLDSPTLPADASKLKDLQITITRRPVIAATSTHPVEEDMMIAAHQRLRGFSRTIDDHCPASS